MSDPYLRHRDITVTEHLSTMGHPHWIARMEGFAIPAGEKVVMGRYAETAAEAIDKLVAALKEQGYEVRMTR